MIIIRNDSITLASAMPSVERVTVLASEEIGAARLNANTTSTMPTSIVVGMLISGSTSQRTSRRRISRCSRNGSSSTLSASVSPADQYRCGCAVPQPTIAVETASVRPWAAKRSISDSTRRCASIANEISSSSAAQRLISCA